jgi:hypothetical protein
MPVCSSGKPVGAVTRLSAEEADQFEAAAKGAGTPDYQLFLTLARGEWSISGFRAQDLRRHINGPTRGRAS